MEFSIEPTRELLFCTTAQSELQLQKHLLQMPGWQGAAAQMAVNHPTRVFAQDGAFMRFWNWDTSSTGEHPLVVMLLSLAKTLPEDQFRLLRITCDDNEVEEAGNKLLFAHMEIQVITAPRIVF